MDSGRGATCAQHELPLWSPQHSQQHCPLSREEPRSSGGKALGGLSSRTNTAVTPGPRTQCPASPPRNAGVGPYARRVQRVPGHKVASGLIRRPFVTVRRLVQVGLDGSPPPVAARSRRSSGSPDRGSGGRAARHAGVRSPDHSPMDSMVALAAGTPGKLPDARTAHRRANAERCRFSAGDTSNVQLRPRRRGGDEGAAALRRSGPCVSGHPEGRSDRRVSR